MAFLRGGNAADLRERNTRLVLRALLRYGQLSRREISRLSGLVPATVSNLVNDLIGRHVLREVGSQARPAGSRGPREVLVDFDAGGVGAIAVGLGIYTRSAGIVGPRGEVVASTGIEEIPAGSTPAETLDWIVATAGRLMRECALSPSAIVGAGIAVEGAVDPVAGVRTYVPYRGWHDVPVVRDLRQRLDVRVAMANSVHAVATGDLLFGRGGEAENLLFTSVFTTLGCVAIARHQVLSGPSPTAGDIGHITVVRDGGELCVCGKRGCLETVAGEFAVISAGRAAAWSGRSPHLLALSGGRPETVTAYTVAQAAVDGDPAAVTIVERVATALAQVLAPIVGVLDPEAVVFDGVLPILADRVFLGPLERAIGTQLPPGREVPRLTTCSVLEQAFPADVARPSLVGAAAVAYERFFFSPQNLAADAEVAEETRPDEVAAATVESGVAE